MKVAVLSPAETEEAGISGIITIGAARNATRMGVLLTKMAAKVGPSLGGAMITGEMRIGMTGVVSLTRTMAVPVMLTTRMRTALMAGLGIKAKTMVMTVAALRAVSADPMALGHWAGPDGKTRIISSTMTTTIGEMNRSANSTKTTKLGRGNAGRSFPMNSENGARNGWPRVIPRKTRSKSDVGSPEGADFFSPTLLSGGTISLTMNC